MSIQPEFSSRTSDNHKRIIVAGVYGGPRAFGLEATLYSEESDFQKVIESQPPNPGRTIIKRTIETTLIIDPLQMKSVHKWLGDNIKEYERLFGTIPSPEELESKSRRDPNQ